MEIAIITLTPYYTTDTALGFSCVFQVFISLQDIMYVCTSLSNLKKKKKLKIKKKIISLALIQPWLKTWNSLKNTTSTRTLCLVT